MFPLMAAVLLLVSLADLPGIERVARSAVLWGGSVLALWVTVLVWRAFTSSLPFYEAKLLIETPLGRSNYLGAFLLFFLAFTWNKPLPLKGLALVALSTLSLYSRGCLLVTFVFLLAVGWSRLLAAKKVALGLGLIIGAILYLSVLHSISGNFSNEGAATYGFDPVASTNNRIALWETSIDLLKDSPFMGIGPNGFRSIVEQENLEDVWGPHNAILLLWLNYGVVGFFFYCVYIFFILRATYKAQYLQHVPDRRFELLCTLLMFSMFEPLVGSGSFEALLAILYAVSASPSAARQSHINNSMLSRYTFQMSRE